MDGVKVVAVDDHELVRAGLRAQLEKAGLRLVGEASSAREAYPVVDSTRPDVVLLELVLPGVDGIAAARELRRRSPRSRILMLSGHWDLDVVSRALSAGADGYALKSEPLANLYCAIRAVCAGRRYLAPGISVDAVELRLKQPGTDQCGAASALSTREREVFDLLVGGLANAEIARELCISVKTVETHRSHIFRKLGVHSIAELIRQAARSGLIRH